MSFQRVPVTSVEV